MHNGCPYALHDPLWGAWVEGWMLGKAVATVREHIEADGFAIVPKEYVPDGIVIDTWEPKL